MFKYLAGMPLYDFGDWTKLRDPKTGKTFFHDRSVFTPRGGCGTNEVVQAAKRLPVASSVKLLYPKGSSCSLMGKLAPD